MNDTQLKVLDKITKRLRTHDGRLWFFVADPGLGKTTGQRLAMEVILQYEPLARFLVVVPTKEDADNYWLAMEEKLPGTSAVWSQDHDPSNKNPEYPPSIRFTKEEAKTYPILIITHNAGKAGNRWMGHRDVALVDEYPQPVATLTLKRSDFEEAVEAEDHAKPYADALLWAQSQQMFGLKQVPEEPWVADVIASGEPYSEKAKLVYEYALKVQQGTAFQRGKGEKNSVPMMSWVAYSYSLPFEDRAIVFSATAHMEGWQYDPEQDGAIERDAHVVPYDRVTAYKHPWPKGVPPVHQQILENKHHQENFVNYVVSLVSGSSQRTAVVCPKGLRSYIEDALSGDVFQRVQVTNWGRDVGSNEYKDCTRVFLVSLPHQKSDVSFSKRLGHSKLLAEDKNLKAGENTNSRTSTETKRAEYLTQIQQMGARGNCRNIDEDGRRGEMELHCVWFGKQGDELYSNYLHRLFPGIKRAKQTSVPSRRQGTSVISRVMDYLQNTDQEEVTTADLKLEKIKIKGRTKQLLENQDVFESIGWMYVPAAQGGGKGNSAKFVKCPGQA
jgi:hypothetical protein